MQTSTRSIDPAIKDLARGRPVLVTHGSPGEEVAEVVIAGALADPRWTAWTIRHTSGFLCAAMHSSRADALNLPPMVTADRTDPNVAVFGVGVDAAAGIGTGISAIDRAHTVRVLSDPATRPENLIRPGHVVPVRAAEHGVLERNAPAEAAIDLCDIAGLVPLALTATLLEDNKGGLLSGTDLSAFAHHHGLALVTVEDIVRHRVHYGNGRIGRIRPVTERLARIGNGSTLIVDFDDELTGAQHTVLVRASPRSVPSVYVAGECEHRDPMGPRCHCRSRFDTYRQRVATRGGMLIYLRKGRRDAACRAVDSADLAQGCITAAVRYFGLDTARVVGWPDGSDAGACRFLRLAPVSAASTLESVGEFSNHLLEQSS